MRYVPMILLTVASVCSLTDGAIVGVAGGTDPPAGTLGPYPMTPFPPDPQALKTYVTSVASPLGGEVIFSEELYHVKVGDGWGYWSHDYTGDVYYGGVSYPNGYSLYLPADTRAFYLYASHGATSPQLLTFTADDGTSVTQWVWPYPEGAAYYYGFYQDSPAGPDLKSLTVSAPGIGGMAVAVGEFGIAIPEPAGLTLLGAGVLVIVGRRR